eukprot:scaffold37790_cov216-Skeletonema_marinoi.AAC.4
MNERLTVAETEPENEKALNSTAAVETKRWSFMLMFALGTTDSTVEHVKTQAVNHFNDLLKGGARRVSFGSMLWGGGGGTGVLVSANFARCSVLPLPVFPNSTINDSSFRDKVHKLVNTYLLTPQIGYQLNMGTNYMITSSSTQVA